ncbi:MAG: hypothetical protein M3Q07_12515, partial [Pseudobdellovibrionaceae bacterium]|nr:hypothetical protein [Pseudobdellovibrionaceae bacterium]
VQRDVVQDLKNQLMVLETILQRYQEVQKKGVDAMAALNGLPTYPTNYIDVDESSGNDTYAIQIEKYLEQIADARNSLSKAQTALLNVGTERFTAIGKSLEGSLLVKIKSVLLDSPVLAEALREAQSALDQMRTVDIVLARLEKERVEIATEISSGGIFQARKRLASWKAKGDATVLGITSNPQVNTTMQDYARQMWGIKVKGLEELLKNMVQGRSDVLIFAGFYNDALYGSFGMVDQCRTTRPRTIDCNLLRTVQGFKRSQLMRLKPEQAAYIESLILKAKQGVMRPKN